MQRSGMAHLGAYEVRSLLGRGEMASVYECRHTKLGRSAAIKVLHPHLARDRDAVARFLREGQALARVEHPNVVEVFDVGEHRSVPYLVMSLVEGEKVRIVAMPKGGGSENYSEVRMLTPSQGVEGIRAFVLDMVRKGGPNPCPPLTVGVGIGGNFETAALLSKEALMVPSGERSPDPPVADLERTILGEINGLGIGPGGYGGTVTALDVHVKVLPCHIASLPVAVNIQCHAHRIKGVTL